MLRTMRAVVFDMDGILLDSEEVWHRARRDFVAGLQAGNWDEEDQKACMGANSRQWSGYMESRFRLAMSADEIYRGVVDLLRQRYEEHLPLIPGADEVVRSLHGRFALAVASSSPLELIEFLVGKMGLSECFNALVSSDEVTHGKPEPDVYLLACRRLEVEPAQAAAIEDSGNGILAAAAAGLRVIAVPNRTFPPSQEALAAASTVLSDIRQITPDLVGSLLNGEEWTS